MTDGGHPHRCCVTPQHVPHSLLNPLHVLSVFEGGLVSFGPSVDKFVDEGDGSVDELGVGVFIHTP